MMGMLGTLRIGTKLYLVVAIQAFIAVLVGGLP